MENKEMSIFDRWEDQGVQFMTPEDLKKFREMEKQQRQYMEQILKEINEKHT